MEKELGTDVIKATQTSLGKYVKRPPLTEKLLKKPPFRFLHDIVTSVLKTHGFFEGLFDEEELISENVKDRDSKILFLNKVITVLALTTGKTLPVKPSKIVAGQEPEKTNELLQSLASALDRKLSSDEAVKKFKDNPNAPQTNNVKTKEKETKSVKKSNDATKLTSKSSEKLSSNKKESTTVNKSDKTKTNDSKSKRKDTTLNKTEAQVKKTQNLKTVGKKKSVESIKQLTNKDTKPVQDQTELNLSLSELKDTTENEQIDPLPEDAVRDATEMQNAMENTPIVETNNAENQEVIGKLDTSYTLAENELNSSLSSQETGDENDKRVDKLSDKLTSNLNESKDITSHEPVNSVKNDDRAKENSEAALLKKPKPALVPKHDSFESDTRDKTREIEKKTRDVEITNNDSIANSTTLSRQASEVQRPPSVRPSSSRPGAPRLREKIDNVIPENENLLLGKVNIIAESAQNDEEEDNTVIIVEQSALSSQLEAENQPDAIQFPSSEHGHLVQQILDSQKELSQNAGKTEIEWQFGAQKSKEASNQETEQLRFNIQALSRVANPLGKLLDHIQEDVEVMRQELQQWTNVYEEVSKDMLKQKAASEETLVPLQTRVKQLDVEIEEKRDKINDIKILINKNTTRIEKLLVSGNVQ